MTSPGSRVTSALMMEISSATPKSRSEVLPSCIWNGFALGPSAARVTHDRTASPRPSPSSSAVTSTGPSGRNVSEPLARSHWPSPFSPDRSAFAWPCQSRAVTSLAALYPATH
jgi:hypothetical protein